MESQMADAVNPATKLAGDRTNMASFRTNLALDRTTLAWIRTTLTLATFGFGMVTFYRSLRQASPTPEAIRLHQNAIYFGMSLIVIGIVATVLAGLSHWFALRRLRRGDTPVLSRWPLSLTVATLLTVLGLWGLWTILAR
jgi:putative membrane protein